MGNLSRIESLVWVHQKEPIRHILGTLMGTFWENFQQVAQVNGGHIESKIVKVLRGFIQKVPAR